MKYVPSFGFKAQVFSLCAAPIFAFLVVPKDRLAANVPVFIAFGLMYLGIAWLVLFRETHRIEIVDEHLIVRTAFGHRVVSLDGVLSVGPAITAWNMSRIRLRGQSGVHVRSSNGYGEFVAHLIAQRPTIGSGYAVGRPRTDQFMSSNFTELTEGELDEARRLIAPSTTAEHA